MLCPHLSLFILGDCVSPVVSVDPVNIEIVCDSLFLFSPKVSCYSGRDWFIDKKETNFKHFQSCREEHLFCGFWVGPCDPWINIHHPDVPAPAGFQCLALPGSIIWGAVLNWELCLCSGKSLLSIHSPFPISRAWTLQDLLHTCLLGFASFSCSPFHSSDSFSGTKNFITRNPVKLLVSISTSSHSLRVYYHNIIIFQRKLPQQWRRFLTCRTWGKCQSLGCCMLSMFLAASWYALCFQGL